MKKPIFASAYITAYLLALLLSGGCQKGQEPYEKGWMPLQVKGIEASTRASASADGSTVFAPGDTLGIFLRNGASDAHYTPVDNRKVGYKGPEWNIDGDVIWLDSRTALTSAYFPYDSKAIIDSIPLSPGAYDIDLNDVVYLQKQVWAGKSILELNGMKHAMARVKIVLKRDDPDDPTKPDRYKGEGKVTRIRIADNKTDGILIQSAGKLDMDNSLPVVSGTTAGNVSVEADYMLAIAPSAPAYDLLLVPVASLSGDAVKLMLTVDGKELEIAIPSSTVPQWKAGESYAYTVTVKSTQVVFDKVTTTQWDSGTGQSGDLQEVASIGSLMGGGIVYWVDPDDAAHYKVISLYEPETKTRDEAAVYCSDYGTGWVLPAQDELTALYDARVKNGGTSDPTASLIDNGIRAYGGDSLAPDRYWSSTAVGSSNSKAVRMSNGSISTVPNTTRLAVRAVKEVTPSVSTNFSSTKNPVTI